MRNGDFSIEVVPAGPGRVRETDSGHVLARPGQVYRLRLRNHGPLRCVVDVDVDGHRVTAGGLVLDPWSTTDLERPIDAHEDGRFTVVAEGDEPAFGPDGGRDDPALGLIVAHFRRELPGHGRRAELPPTLFPSGAPPTRPLPGVTPMPPRYPASPPEWMASERGMRLLNALAGDPSRDASAWEEITLLGIRATPKSFDEAHGVETPAAPPTVDRKAGIERAAGTGLTGHSDQQFVPIHVGPLEEEATVLQLRIVIGTEEAIAAEPARPLGDRQAPARPAARP